MNRRTTQAFLLPAGRASVSFIYWPALCLTPVLLSLRFYRALLTSLSSGGGQVASVRQLTSRCFFFSSYSASATRSSFFSLHIVILKEPQPFLTFDIDSFITSYCLFISAASHSASAFPALSCLSTIASSISILPIVRSLQEKKRLLCPPPHDESIHRVCWPRAGDGDAPRKHLRNRGPARRRETWRWS